MIDPNEQPNRRDFEHLSDAVKKLTSTLEGLPNAMAAIYLRQDVYERDQRLHDITHADQQKEIDKVTGWWEWAGKIIGGAFLLGLTYLLWQQGR